MQIFAIYKMATAIKIAITLFLTASISIKIWSGCDLDLIPQGIFGT